MTGEELQLIIDNHEGKEYKAEYQQAYARGNHVAINQPFPRPAPDNRKSVPFIKRAIAMIKGYMSQPGNITYSGEYYDNVLKAIFDFNDEALVTSNELEDGLIFGKYFELHWFQDGEKHFYPIPIDQAIPVYDDGLKPKLSGFIWYREIGETCVATVYNSMTYQEWTKAEDGKVWTPGEELPHGYGMVPVNCGKISRDCSNMFDHVLGLIDLYDKIISEDFANEAERYAAAYMLLGTQINDVDQDSNGRTDLDNIKHSRVIQDLGDNVTSKVAFLTKNIPTQFMELTQKTVERLIYEMLMIVNPSDDTFATASGVAQAYKLLGMEYLCAGIETFLSMFLQNRIKIISGLESTLGGSTEGSDQVNIKFTRNLPKNLVELAQVASTLKGTLSDETILGLFPANIIPDVKAELEKTKATEPGMVDTLNAQ